MNPIRSISVATVFGLCLGGAAIAQPQPAPSAPANAAIKSPREPGQGVLARGHNSFTRGQARKRIEKSGYTQVTGLRKDARGLWQAEAQKDGSRTHVALDYKGDVSAQP